MRHGFTREERKRRSYLIRVLSDLSKDGWARATYSDYRPLECELRQIEERMT